MEHILEIDRKLGRIRTELIFSILRPVFRAAIITGAFSEVMLYIMTNKEYKKVIETEEIGVFENILVGSRRREIRRKTGEVARKILKEKFGDKWAHSVRERMYLSGPQRS